MVYQPYKPDIQQETVASVKFARDLHVAEEHAQALMLYDLALRVEGIRDSGQISEELALAVLDRVESLKRAAQLRRHAELRAQQQAEQAETPAPVPPRE